MDKKQKLICTWSLDFAIGGTESYMIRMAKWAYNVGIDCYFALKDNCLIDKSWEQEINKYNISVEYYKYNFLNSIKIEKRFDKFLKTENCTVISTDIASYIRFLRFKTIYKLNNLTILYYVLHPLVSKISNKKYINFIYKNFFLKEIENSFLYMDEECINEANRFYNQQFHISNIYRLACFVDELNLQTIKKRQSNKVFNVLSISRMAFPFKGYQIGLIKSIPEILSKNQSINFTIIGDGPDAHIIDEEVAKLSKENQSHVKHIGNVPYKELKNYFNNSNLYIGMGTTLLDAANTGLPSVIATWNSYEPQSIGYFVDHWNNVGGDDNQPDIIKDSFSNLILNISSMTAEEYESFSINTYKQFQNNYDIYLIMNKIMNLSIKKQKISFILSGIDYLLWNYRDFVISRRK